MYRALALKALREKADLGDEKGLIDIANNTLLEVFTDEKIGSLMSIAMPAANAKEWFGAAPPDLTMVSRVREKLVSEGLDAVVMRKKRETPPTPAIFDGEAQAKLTALACSEPPPGPAPTWTRPGSGAARVRSCERSATSTDGSISRRCLRGS